MEVRLDDAGLGELTCGQIRLLHRLGSGIPRGFGACTCGSQEQLSRASWCQWTLEHPNMCSPHSWVSPMLHRLCDSM